MTRRLLVTTVVREAGLAQDSGFLYVLDLDRGQPLLEMPMPESLYRARDLNPRGGLRGARGVSACGDRLVLANSERLLFFDVQWRPIGEFSHPRLGGIHDILAQNDGVWVTSTNADLLVKVSWGGELLADWSWRDDPGLRQTFGLPHLPPVDRTLDYRDPATMRGGVYNTVHLNSVSSAPDGGLLLSFGRVLSPASWRRAGMNGRLGAMARKLGLPGRGSRFIPPGLPPVGRIPGCSAAIVWLKADGQTQVLAREQDTAVPNHNVLWAEDRLLYNDSNGGALVSLSLAEPGCVHRMVIPGAPSFARGLALLDNRTALVGSQAPAAIYRAELDDHIVTLKQQLSGRSTESVFALCLLPAHFAQPPEQLGLR